jgi:alpha-L-fucosidase
VEGADGKILVAFFGGTGEGEKDVVIWQSFKEKGQWAAPTTIADGVMNDTLRYPCWNPVLFKEAAGKLFLFYKQGPKPFNWWGVFKTSDDNGKTWSPSENLPEGILGPIKNKPVLLNDGSILSPSSSEENGTWKVFMEKSSDHGKTWRLIPVDTGSRYRVIQPTILRYGQGHLQILCRSNQNKILQAWSKDNGNSWSSLTPTLLPNPNSGIDAVTLKSGWQMLVYNPTTKGKDWANGRQKLSVAVSQNGRQWKDVAVLENGTTEEFSYPAIIETDDGKVHITYTWDRKNIKHVVLAVTSK